MTFDQSVVVCSILAPAMVMIVGLTIGRWQEKRCLVSSGGIVMRLPIVAVGWWAAITVSLWLRQGWQWWPADAWRQAVWPALGWALLAAAFQPDDAAQPVAPTSDLPAGRACGDRSGRWIIAALLSLATAMIAMPAGENWQDTFVLHRTWIPVVAAACLLNSWSLWRMAAHGAQRWVLAVALAGLAGPLALAASTYGSLTEWAMAATVAALVATLAAAMNLSAVAGTILFPLLAFAASVTAAGRFHTYEDHPWWIYLAILFLPTIVFAADGLISRRPVVQRIAVAAIISSTIVCLAGWMFLVRETSEW